MYVNDVIINSTGAKEQEMLANHARHVEQVLELFAQHNLVAKLSKASAFSSSAKFCGQILEGGKGVPNQGTSTAFSIGSFP